MLTPINVQDIKANNKELEEKADQLNSPSIKSLKSFKSTEDSYEPIQISSYTLIE